VVRVDVQRDVRPDGLAHEPDALDVFRQHLLHRVPLLRTLEARGRDHHLEPSLSRCDVRPRRGNELAAIERRLAEGGVRRDDRARAAEQAPHRLSVHLARDVPQREIHRRDRVHRMAGVHAAQHERSQQALVDGFARQGILAGDLARDDVAHHGDDDGQVRDRSEAVAPQSARRLDTDDDACTHLLGHHTADRLAS
jgi:hypothetical protein